MVYFFAKSVTTHTECFFHPQSSMSRIIFISTNSTSETFCLQLFVSVRNKSCSSVLVLQYNLGVGVFTLLGNCVPRCKAMDSKRNLTWEQYTPGNSSQDSLLCLFLQNFKALDGRVPLSLALCCHLNCLKVHKSMWKVGKVTIREEMLPF